MRYNTQTSINLFLYTRTNRYLICLICFLFFSFSSIFLSSFSKPSLFFGGSDKLVTVRLFLLLGWWWHLNLVLFVLSWFHKLMVYIVVFIEVLSVCVPRQIRILFRSSEGIQRKRCENYVEICICTPSIWILMSCKWKSNFFVVAYFFISLKLYMDYINKLSTLVK